MKLGARINSDCPTVCLVGLPDVLSEDLYLCNAAKGV